MTLYVLLYGPDRGRLEKEAFVTQLENRLLKCGDSKMIINECDIRYNNIFKTKVYQLFSLSVTVSHRNLPTITVPI